MKVLICIPTRGMLYYKVAAFVASQAEMGFPSLYSSSSYGTEAARKKLTNTFLKFDYDYLFFLDDDVVPPNDVIGRLLKHDVDICTAEYPMLQEGELKSHCSLDGFHLSLGAYEGTMEIEKCGLGACLIKRKVVEACKDDFGFEFDDQGNVVKSEDYWFCEKARAKGYKIFADFDVVCKHFKPIPLGGE